MAADARVFISHTHSDEPIARALDDSIRALFGDAVHVSYSTKKEHGGIEAGDDWIQWIAEEVGLATVAIVLLTPASVQKPWVLWEAGAVAGTALGAHDKDRKARRKVRPVAYHLKSSEIPPPFKHIQIVNGDSVDGATKLFDSFINDFPLTTDQVRVASRRVPGVVKEHVQIVADALLNAPMLPNEDVVQEWCLRLDTLREEGRASEASQVHDWLNVSFGRARDGDAIPIDLRIHRRLGEMYLESRQYEMAAKEFELGRRLAPRDIFILRELGRAYLGKGLFDATKKIIDRIEELDPKAFAQNVECAALKGRWYRDQGDMKEALKVYQTAHTVNRQSYYLGDLVGQTQLALGDVRAARETYEGVFNILRQLGEQNVWTHAAAATAALVLGREAEVDSFLDRARSAGATAENMRSIEEGLDKVRASLKSSMALGA